jgi:hypothetical protein
VRRALAVAAAAVLTGCGKDTPPAESPREAFRSFVMSVADRDASAPDLVSRRLDEQQREGFVGAERRDIEPWAREYRIILDERIGDDLAVVAAQGRRHPEPGAYAVVLAQDDDMWLVEPSMVDLIYGSSALSGADPLRPTVDFEVNVVGDPEQLGREIQARMWIDGKEVRLRREAGYRFVADIRRLQKRVHSVVAFASVGDRRGAIAWTFPAG